MHKSVWYWLNILLFALLLGGALVANIFFRTPSGYASFENRSLREFPGFTWEELWAGEFTQSIDEWYSDTTPGRQYLVEANAALQELRGLSDADESEIILRTVEDPGVANFNQEPLTEEQKLELRQYILDFGKSLVTLFTEPEVIFAQGFVDVLPKRKPPPPAIDRNAEGMVGSFLVLGDTSYEIVHYKKASGTYYAQMVNRILQNAPPDVTFYSAIVPSHLHFVENRRYQSLGADQKTAIREIQSQLDGRIKKIDVLSALTPHQDEYLYFRSDHHWTANGAFYGYQQFSKAAGFTAKPREAFTKRQISGFLGSLFYKTLSNRLRNNPDVVDVYIPEAQTAFYIYHQDKEYQRPMLNFQRGTDHTNKYLVFINGDDPLSLIKTNILPERKILVFKDSYANAFIPFLSNHYSEIHIVDPRHYQGNALSYLVEKGIKEVLFFNYFAILSSHQGFVRNLARVTAPLPRSVTQALNEQESPAGQIENTSQTQEAAVSTDKEEEAAATDSEKEESEGA
jgi:hypothetical protein